MDHATGVKPTRDRSDAIRPRSGAAADYCVSHRLDWRTGAGYPIQRDGELRDPPARVRRLSFASLKRAAHRRDGTDQLAARERRLACQRKDQDTHDSGSGRPLLPGGQADGRETGAGERGGGARGRVRDGPPAAGGVPRSPGYARALLLRGYQRLRLVLSKKQLLEYRPGANGSAPAVGARGRVRAHFEIRGQEL